MSKWNILKNAVINSIYENGNQEITGSLLRSVLITMVNNLGENATYVGLATTSTNPGAPDGPVFYLATTAGTYSNFGGITLSSGEAAILRWTGTNWVKDSSGFATQQQVDQAVELVTSLQTLVESLSEDIDSVSGDVSNLEARVANEEQRAQQEEARLEQEIFDLGNRHDEELSEAQDAWAKESERLGTQIAEERARAMAAEQTNANNITAEQNRASAAEQSLAETINIETTQRRAAISGEEERAKSEEARIEQEMTQKISQAISDLLNSAPEAFDTLGEIAQWITNDQTGAAAISAQVNKNTSVNTAQTEVLKRLDRALEPLVVKLSGGDGLYEAGTSQEVTIGWTVTKGGSSIIPSLLTTTVNGTNVGSVDRITETVTKNKEYYVACSFKYEIIPGSGEENKNTVTGSARTKVTFVGAKWVGASAVADAAVLDKTTLVKRAISRTPLGSYVVVPLETSYIWFVVPSEMTISKVTLNGFNYPIESAVERDGYKYYRSSNQAVANTKGYTFVVQEGTGI